ncbi:hypothetical protein C5S53_15965 [Methanophagales archaeon]|nr:hypothetical protein C5S53_15965 [Methanophagales archaeon]
MYNNLIFDDGAYDFSGNENGVFEVNIPPEKLKLSTLDVPTKPRTGFRLNAIDEKTGQSFNLIPQSENGNNYSVIASFQKLINDLGIQDENFIHFEWTELTPINKKILDQMVKSTGNYKKYIRGNPLFQEYILKNFHHSLILSKAFNTPMMIDSLYDNLLTNIMSKMVNISDVRLEVLNRVCELLNFDIPDFSSLEIEKILDLRNDKLFIEFRNKLLDINNCLTQNEMNQFDPSKIDPLLIRELIKEIVEIAPSNKKLLVKGSLGVAGSIPVFGPIATGVGLAKDSKELLDFNKNWLAFIIKNSQL